MTGVQTCALPICVARVLRNYGIKPKTMRIGTKVGRGYDGIDFKTAVNRYVPKDAIDKRMAQMHEVDAMEVAAREEWEKEKAAQRAQKAEDYDQMLEGRAEEVLEKKKEAIREMRRDRQFAKQATRPGKVEGATCSTLVAPCVAP